MRQSLINSITLYKVFIQYKAKRVGKKSNEKRVGNLVRKYEELSN